MEIYKALSRIKWRFEQGKSFLPNETDITAFNGILKYYEQTQKEQFEANQLFGKLYIYVYMRFISKMETTVMDIEPRKAIHKILQKSVEQWVMEFTKEMNDSEMYSFLNSIPPESKDYDLISEKITEKVWDYETVKDCLTLEINNAINLYR